MKLNKVLALALSGVMAVSMLAGCSGNPADGEQGGDQGEVVVDANDISDGVASYIVDAPKYVTFNGDRDLSDKLDLVVQQANVKDVVGGFMENGLHEMRGRNAEELQKRLEDLVGVTKWTDKWGREENVEIGNIGNKSVLVEAEKADEDKMEIDDAKAVQLYVTSGVIGSDGLNYLVATKIDDIIGEYEHVVQNGGNNGIYDHNYTVSVSTSSKSVNGAEATFVAVQVVRSSVRS